MDAHPWCVGISFIKNQILNHSFCFNKEETTSSKRLLLNEKNVLPIGSIFFPLKVAALNYGNVSLKFDAANIKWFTVYYV